MAQPYPYLYHGVLCAKQDKCTPSIPLDRARIWLDFNKICASGPALISPAQKRRGRLPRRFC